MQKRAPYIARNYSLNDRTFKKTFHLVSIPFELKLSEDDIYAFFKSISLVQCWFLNVTIKST